MAQRLGAGPQQGREAANQSGNNRWIVAGSLAVIIARSPILLWHGRVVAEEGTVYLQQAWTASIIQTLLMVHQGYYSLLMNLLSLLNARILPLEWMSVAMVVAAQSILLLTVWLAVECEAFTDARSRCFAAAVCILTPSIEVWGAAEDAQFVLALATALVCLSVADRHPLVRTATLLLASLTGPVSCVFTPIFLYRAHRQRTLWSAVQAIVISLCSAVQGLILFEAVRTGTRPLAGSVKDAWFGPILVLKIFSVEFFTRLGAFAAQRAAVHHPTAIVCVFFWVLFLLFMALFVKMARVGGEVGWLCLVMALMSLAFNYQGIAESVSIIRIGAFRYFFTGNALFSLTLVAAYASAARRKQRRELKFARVLVMLTLMTGFVDAVGYWKRLQGYEPDWRTDVRAWRHNSLTPIRVFPYNWPDTMSLPPENVSLSELL